MAHCHRLPLPSAMAILGQAELMGKLGTAANSKWRVVSDFFLGGNAPALPKDFTA